MIPKRFFVTSGKATSPVSELNAFDEALERARIAQCNIVTVSSILPGGCKEVEPRDIPVGSITYAVLARMDGEEGTTIGTGTAYGFSSDMSYGIVAEAHGYMDSDALKEILEWKIEEMAKIRHIRLSNITYRIEVLRVPMDSYGCVVCALVYLLE
ncbi:pyruvoyl-dependent arginine decarboxylase [Candidatus Bathyarchaeota archaeon]|jgi:arginine decarboxylase|nr:pyruvoyl-dependent arginine decarboxylase [Candidatus Bathyarchaeota archaeon]